jgi:hypothetical protein
MRQWLKKWFGGSPQVRPAGRRGSFRPQLELLDERLLPSNTGSLSEVFAYTGMYDSANHNNGSDPAGPVLYYIGNDHNLYESFGGAWAQQLDFEGIDLQVSAGVDANRNPVAYVLNRFGSLWALTTGQCWQITPWGWNLASQVVSEVHVADGVLYGPRFGLSEFSSEMGYNPNTQSLGTGVFFISNYYDYYYSLSDNFYQRISGSPVDTQISAGMDDQGFSVAYVRNSQDDNAYEYHVKGNWWSQVTTGHDCDVVVGGAYGEAFFLFGWSQKLASWKDGVFHDIANNVQQISASFDNVDYIQNGTAWQYRLHTNTTYYMGSNVREVCGTDAETDYVVDGNNNLWEFDWWRNPTTVEQVGWNVS